MSMSQKIQLTPSWIFTRQVRVHEVKEMAQTAKVCDRIYKSPETSKLWKESPSSQVWEGAIFLGQFNTKNI